jgi:gliding motility-associated-like protein
MASLLRNNSIKAVWLLCHAALFLGYIPATSQHNLVPNGSFEIYDTCPYFMAQLEFAKPWRDIASVELYNTCSQGVYVGVPKNVNGFQFPRSGNGYAGFVPSGNFDASTPLPQGTVYHEYPQVELRRPLEKGTHYCYQYFVSPTYFNYGNCVLKELSIVLSDTPISYDWNSLTPPFYIDHPVTHTCHLGFTTDTIAWYEVKGEFMANGGEVFLTIGIFRLLSNNDFFCPNGYTNLIRGAYYYIDDVSVWPCDAPVYEADAGRDKQICYGDEVILGQNLPDDEYRFLWSSKSHQLTPKDQWDTLATTPYLLVKPEQTTTYYLWVRDFKMDITYDSVTVFVESCITPPEIPNVFTPNGDGFNDLFAFKNHELWELETCIRNRWGQVVFEGKNDLWWDGTIHGQPAAEGVYFYTVTARNQFGQHKEFHGVVTLLR